MIKREDVISKENERTGNRSGWKRSYKGGGTGDVWTWSKYA
jgi:hypothetical protein